MKRWLYRLRAFCHLASEDRASLVIAWLLLVTLPGLCRLVGVRTGWWWLRRLAGFFRPLPALPNLALGVWVERQGDLVSHAARYCPHHPTCLIRALVLWFLLARRGVACDLRLGVEKTSQMLNAHAWVEWCGRPVMESPDVRQRYAVFDTTLDAS